MENICAYYPCKHVTVYVIISYLKKKKQGIFFLITVFFCSCLMVPKINTFVVCLFYVRQCAQCWAYFSEQTKHMHTECALHMQSVQD